MNPFNTELTLQQQLRARILGDEITNSLNYDSEADTITFKREELENYLNHVKELVTHLYTLQCVHQNINSNLLKERLNGEIKP